MDWLEQHFALAGWVSAIGGIAAVAAAFLVANLQTHAERQAAEEERQLRAEALAVLLVTDTVEFVGYLREVIGARQLMRARGLKPPAALVARLGELYLLGSAGGSLLQLVSALNATRRMTERHLQAIADYGGDDREPWKIIKSNLEIAAADGDDAIAAMNKIISLAADRIQKRERSAPAP